MPNPPGAILKISLLSDAITYSENIAYALLHQHSRLKGINLVFHFCMIDYKI